MLYVDSTAGFSASRVAQVLLPQGAPASRAALSRVRRAAAFDVHDALLVLDAALRGEGGPVALVVVDSASALLAPLLTTRHPQGHALMLALATALRAVAEARTGEGGRGGQRERGERESERR